MDKLRGMKVALLVANGFEQSEFTEPKAALENAGAIVEVISPEKDKVRGWKNNDWGDSFTIDVPLEQAAVEDYSALLLPGGVINPDKLRLDPMAIDFIKQIYKAKKPIAAICHGLWPLINAGVADGRKLTSWPSIRLDLINAGADWVDEKVVVDGRLVTSRKPEDIAAFNEAMIKLFAKEAMAA